MVRCLVGGLACGVLGLIARPAAAQDFPEEPARLEYVRLPGAEGCPPEAAFHLEVEIVRHGAKGFLPADVYDDETDLVRVIVERWGGKYRGTIVHVPGGGRPAKAPQVRVNSECTDLVRDLASPASFFLPLEAEEGCGECPECAAAPGGAAAPAVAVGKEAREERRCDPDGTGPENDALCLALQAKLNRRYGRPVEPSVWLSAGGLLTLLYTSDPGPGFWLGGRVQGKHWSVGLEAQVTLPAPVRAGTSPNGQPRDFDVSTFVGLVVPCARLGETVVFVGCGVLGAGGYLTHDSQAPTDKGDFFETVRIGPRAGLEVPLGTRLSFFAYGEVSFAPILYVANYNGVERWVQSAASLFLSTGLSVRLTD